MPKTITSIVFAFLLVLAALPATATPPQAPPQPAPAAQPTAQPVARKANPNTQYGRAQQKLREAGLYSGDVTGYKNPETVTALREFQKRNGLKETGTLSKETRDKLGLTSPTKKA